MIDDLFQTYLAFVEARRSPLTLSAYSSDLRVFQKFCAEQMYQLEAIDLSTLDLYLGWLHKKNYSAFSIERRLQVLRSFYKWAVPRGHLNGDPFLVWEMPRAKQRVPRALSHQDDRRLLDLLVDWRRNAHDQMIATGIRLARFAGLRRGEVANLAWEDLDFTQEQLVVRHGKGDEDRIIPIPEEELVEPLRRWHAFMGRPTHGSLLKGITGGGLPDKSLSRGVHRFYRKAEIHYATFHTLRTTYATRLAELGVYPSVIQELLGHKSLETTMVYIAVAPAHKRAAVRLLDGGRDGGDGPRA